MAASKRTTGDAMYVYAGIDEAGYGPMYGPLTIGCAVLVLPDLASDAPPPKLWDLLSDAVCTRLRGRRGRLAINDSKKLTTKAAGIKHLEAGCLAFAGINESPVMSDLASWLDLVGVSRHRASDDAGDDGGLSALPWYACDSDRPWDALPHSNTQDEIAIARSMLSATCKKAGVQLSAMRCEVLFEDMFNRMVEATRSKASVSFTSVARHLLAIFNQHGAHQPHVAVDRQSGRMRYREILAQVFEGARIDVLGETPIKSAYHITLGANSMTVTFQIQAEESHMPVALASMVAKYTRELLMHRFNSYFAQIAPEVKPTAGYGTDANRWRDAMLPILDAARIDHARLRRRA